MKGLKVKLHNRRIEVLKSEKGDVYVNFKRYDKILPEKIKKTNIVMSEEASIHLCRLLLMVIGNHNPAEAESIIADYLRSNFELSNHDKNI